MRIKVLLWDIGGVLERTKDLAPRKQLAQQLNLSMDALDAIIFGQNDQYRVQLGIISPEEHLQNMAAQFGVSLPEAVQIVEQFFSEDFLDISLVHLIRHLKNTFRTAVLSNYSSKLRWKIDHQWQIADCFDEVFISAEIGKMKPDPDIYRYCMKKLNAEASEIVFVDDSSENIQAAAQLGMHTIPFKNPVQCHQALAALLNLTNEGE